MKHILFMCVANSARSQLAEGLAKSILGSGFQIESAGAHPCGIVQPAAITVLKELGIDISRNTSKGVDELPEEFVENLDYVVTLCAEQVCPTVLLKKVEHLHWPIPDPTAHAVTSEDRLKAFRQARDNIRMRLEKFRNEIKAKQGSDYPY